ncbi:MAG: PqqD family protein [Elusimicrobiota bacterium]
MGKNASAAVYKHADHVSWRRVEDEVVILDLDSSDYFSLNDVGALIWERLGKGETSEQILDSVCGEFDVAPEKALKEMQALVKQLTGKKLLLAA